MPCTKYCAEKSVRRTDAAIKREVLLILSFHGIETNSKIASIAPKWANEILSVSIGFGKRRYKNISYYLAALCEYSSNLTAEQKKLVAQDPETLASAAITTRMIRGQAYCNEIAGNPQQELLAA